MIYCSLLYSKEYKKSREMGVHVSTSPPTPRGCGVAFLGAERPKMVDISPKTWNQLFGVLQDWAVILNKKPDPAFRCEMVRERRA